MWSLRYTEYSEYGVYAGGVYSTLDTVNMECMLVESTLHWVQRMRNVCLWSLQYTGYSEYGVYACGVYGTLNTVNMECMLVESTVHWIQ